MSYKLRALLFCVSSAFLGQAAAAQDGRPEIDGRIPVFGSLHSHSVLSGDVSGDEGFTARQAFDYARTNGLDFLGISDHHKGDPFPGGTRFRLDLADYRADLFDVAAELNGLHEGVFVAIPGIEWGTVKTGNHINIFGADALPAVVDTDYSGLYAFIAANADFAQCNHPYSWKASRGENQAVGNYGRTQLAPDTNFVATADPGLKLMSIICTVFGGHISGQHADSEDKTHRDVHAKAFREWLEHLNMGFHLSPGASQDTHGRNPGTVTAARTGVWVEELSYDGLTAAIRDHRVFATEDDELAVLLRVDYDGETFWMGDEVPLQEEEEMVTLRIVVEQIDGSDGDPAGEGPYEVSLYSDFDGIGNRLAAVWDTFEIDAGFEFEVTVPVVQGEYIFLEITETNGQDNPVGDGDDEFDADGNDGADGNRDDLNDSAWTTPVWFVTAG